MAMNADCEITNGDTVVVKLTFLFDHVFANSTYEQLYGVACQLTSVTVSMKNLSSNLV